MEWLLYLLLISLATFTFFQSVRMSRLANKAVLYGKEAKKAEQKLNNPDHKVLVIGDSTAVGTGTTSPASSLVGRLAADLPRADITNAAINAMNLRELEQHLQPHQNQNYDHIIIHIGGMDTITLLPTFILRKQAKNSLLLAKNIANKKVFLVSVYNVGTAPFFQFPLNHYFSVRSKKISSIFNEICEELEVTHIPLYEETELDLLYKDCERNFCQDGLHPNDNGYEIWYQKIKPIVLKEIN